MRIDKYTCTLLSDVIITSMAATEGFKESLDYIPGAKFLGIVAGKLYDMNAEEKTHDVFHSGKVQFSDATLMYNNVSLKKIPFSWFHEKGKKISDGIYIHHLNQNPNLQLKQARNGYFSESQKVFVSIEQGFSLKSAHDSENRRSKDGQMFGYFSLKKGSTWSFTVSDITGLYADEIKNCLIGSHRIGRSRSAEFGLIDVDFVEHITPSNQTDVSKEIIIYAESNLCFYNDKTGQPTAIPTPKQLTGNANAKILWDKCQIRTRNYKTWNRHRANKDAERIIIERGSAFVVHIEQTISTHHFEKGIGSHLNEGFGSVIVNPSFLTENQVGYVKVDIEYDNKFAIQSKPNDDVLINCLIQRKQNNDFDYNIDKMVNDFISSNKSSLKSVSNSQWGVLRNHGKNCKHNSDFDKLVFDDAFGFVNKGVSEKEWRIAKVPLKRHLDEIHINKNLTTAYLPFVIKLSTQMAKTK